MLLNETINFSLKCPGSFKSQSTENLNITSQNKDRRILKDLTFDTVRNLDSVRAVAWFIAH
jgi:hypothetical protein